MLKRGQARGGWSLGRRVGKKECLSVDPSWEEAKDTCFLSLGRPLKDKVALEWLISGSKKIVQQSKAERWK